MVVASGSVNQEMTFLCQCTGCYNYKKATGMSLRAKTGAKSCGCLRVSATKKANTTHGHSVDRVISQEFGIWMGMKGRCSPKGKDPRYKGRTICDRWMASFEAFLTDMGPRPSTGHSVDRINNDLGYSPDNCRWATRTEQARNRKGNVFVTFNGETKTTAEWGYELGLGKDTINKRIRNGETDPTRILSREKAIS